MRGRERERERLTLHSVDIGWELTRVRAGLVFRSFTPFAKAWKFTPRVKAILKASQFPTFTVWHLVKLKIDNFLIISSFLWLDECFHPSSVAFPAWTRRRNTSCSWTSSRRMTVATNSTTPAGWWPARLTLRCRNECTSIPTRPQRGNNGCKRSSPSISSSWPTTLPTSTASWVSMWARHF